VGCESVEEGDHRLVPGLEEKKCGWWDGGWR